MAKITCYTSTMILQEFSSNTETKMKSSSISHGSLISQSRDSSEKDLIKMLFCMSFQFPRRGYENMKYIVVCRTIFSLCKLHTNSKGCILSEYGASKLSPRYRGSILLHAVMSCFLTKNVLRYIVKLCTP